MVHGCVTANRTIRAVQQERKIKGEIDGRMITQSLLLKAVSLDPGQAGESYLYTPPQALRSVTTDYLPTSVASDNLFFFI